MENWSRVERLFHAVMEKPNDRRRAYLNDACNSVSEYDECMRLVKSAEAVDDFMSTSIGLAPFAPSLARDDVLGNWRIDKIIGSGGMGEVYLVHREADDFDHTAALKLARTNDAKYLARFEQERQILAKLEHANIGRLIDGGINADDQPYFVMEWVDGQSITEFATNGNLTQSARLKLFIQLCRAVSHAHTRLVLHRDITPANVLVGEDGQVKLIDFGVADNLDVETVSTSAPTTRAYAAPEQLSGGTISTATDVYALGGLLYEVLTEVRLKNVQDLSENLPTDLRHIVQKCRMHDPVDRYISVDALAQDINRFSKSEPISARESGWVYRAGKFVSRYKLATIASALLFLSLVGGLSTSLFLNGRANTALAAMERANQEMELNVLIGKGFEYSFLSLYGESSEGDDSDKIDSRKIDAALLRLARDSESRVLEGSKIHAYYMLVAGQIFSMRGDDEAIPIFEALLAAETENQNLIVLSKIRIMSMLFNSGQRENVEAMGRDILKTYDTVPGFSLGEHLKTATLVARTTGLDEDQLYAIDVAKQIIAKLGQYPDKLTNFDELAAAHSNLANLYNDRRQYKLASDEFGISFKTMLNKGITSLTGIQAGTNAAGFQIYFGLDGRTPLEYLPPLLDQVDKFGVPPERKGYIYSLMAEAALHEGEWELAIEHARQANIHFADDKKAFWGTYYNNLTIEAKALAQMKQLDAAKLFMQTIKSGFGPDEPSGIYAQCRFDFADAYIAALSDEQSKAQLLFDTAVTVCKKVREPYDVLNGSLQYHADRVEELLE